jgi:S1-C subfamily serine protease
MAKKRGSTLGGLVLSLIGLILVNVGMLTWLSLRALDASPERTPPQLAPIDVNMPAQHAPLPEDLTDHEKRTIEVFRRSEPSVVFITTLSVRRNLLNRDVMAIPAGTGSGFIWDGDGHIVTNYHVVAEGNAARVTLSDQSTYAARLIGHAADKDLAVLRIDAPADKLHKLAVGNSTDIFVGQTTLAIGNPFGLDHTLSTGVISGLEREIKSRSGRPIFGVIQTDAAINPGNSGGPLLDSRGRLIGINTAIFSPTGASAGIGFAVPVGIVKRIVPQLIKHGKVIRPGLGISFDPALQLRTGVKGILVLGVQSGSAAHIAGIKPTTRDPESGALVLGDIIISIDGTPVKDQNDLFKVLDEKAVGDDVKVGVRRGENELTLDLKLTALPDP